MAHRIAVIVGAAFLIGLLVALAAIAGGSTVLFAVAILLVLAAPVFLVGFVAQLAWRREPLPGWIPWGFGVGCGVVRLVAPGLGGVTVYGGNLVSAVLTALWAGILAGGGASAAIALRARRQGHRTAGAEGGPEA